MNKFVKLLLPLPILLSPAIVLAGTKTSLSANINSGSLTITAPSVSANFTGVHLNGRVQKTYTTLSDWSVTDATGTGNGWTVDLSASQLTEVPPSGGLSSGTSAKLLPEGSLSLSGSRSVVASSGSTAVSSSGGPLLKNVSATIDTSSPVEILSAGQGYGLGHYTVNEPTDGLCLTLQPSSTSVDSVNYPSSPTPYESTLTYTVSSAPTVVQSEPTPSGMIGTGVPIDSTYSASSSAGGSPSSYAFNGDLSDNWNSDGFTGSVEAFFGTPISISEVQIAANASPSATESYNLYGDTPSGWVQIGYGSRTVSSSSATILSPFSLTTPGQYTGLKVVVNGGASWVGINDITFKG